MYLETDRVRQLSPVRRKEQEYRSGVIRRINDAFRSHVDESLMRLSPGILNLSKGDRNAVLKNLREFADFSPTNDFYGEHDAGQYTADVGTIIWRIDYYDPTMTRSPKDPANFASTVRVLTVTLVGDHHSTPP